MKNKFIAVFLLLSIIIVFPLPVLAQGTLEVSIIEPDDIKAGETIEIKLMIENLPYDVIPAVIMLNLRFNNEKINPIKGVGTQIPFIVTSENEWDLSLCRLIEAPQDNYIECVFFCLEATPDTAVGMAFTMTAEVLSDYTEADSLELEITYLMYMNSDLEEFVVYNNENTSEPDESSQQSSESQIDESHDESIVEQESQEVSKGSQASQSIKEPMDTGKIIGIIIIALTLLGLIVLLFHFRNSKKKNKTKKY